MKVGDLVKLKKGATRCGVVIDMIQKKVWRTHIHGKKVNWDIVDPEPHAVVLYADDTMCIPLTDLEGAHESG